MSDELKRPITFGKFQDVDLRAARVGTAGMASATRFPSRLLELDLGPLGARRSVGQYALLEEDELVGALVVVCANLAPRRMGPHLSEVLVLGTPHPESPPDQDQALPLLAHPGASPGDSVF
jgi:tRNA-binding protein